MLFRQSTIIQQAVRRTQDFKAIRRENRRLKMINTLSPDFTGEDAFNQWADQKRLKALAKMYEDIRNKHRFTIKVEDKDKPALKKQFEELAEIQYAQRMRNNKLRDQFNEVFLNTIAELKTLPQHLKQTRKTPYGDQKPYPEQIQDFVIYYEQLMRLYPEEIAFNYKVANRLLNIAGDHPLTEQTGND